jgi:uncharacterized pyridoxamine 5'-phosphate oxidase family protein
VFRCKSTCGHIPAFENLGDPTLLTQTTLFWFNGVSSITGPARTAKNPEKRATMKEKPMNESLDFDELKIKNLDTLHRHNRIYLATVWGGKVRSRLVDYHNEGLRIGFITWSDTVKVQHIRHNPTVALCIENLQIQGTAKLTGHPGLPGNSEFASAYKERHPTPYNNFIEMDNTIVVMVEPMLTIMMVHEEHYFYLDHLDLVENAAYRKMLSSWDIDL